MWILLHENWHVEDWGPHIVYVGAGGAEEPSPGPVRKAQLHFYLQKKKPE